MLLIMNKPILLVLLLLLSAVGSYSQTNPYYSITQENIKSPYYNLEVVGFVQDGNAYEQPPSYPAYTTFLIDGYVYKNIPDSLHIQGLPLGFNFPYAGQVFDIYALNSKGYIVLGKSSEGGMTVYADTLQETAMDTVFTAKNKYMISGLYTGKNMDLQGGVTVYINKGGFVGDRGLNIVLENAKKANGGMILVNNSFELTETGEINIVPSIYPEFATNIINTYATFMQRYGTSYTQYIYGTGATSSAWFNTTESYNNTSYSYGTLRDTVMPLVVNQASYTINYYPKPSNFNCPTPIVWNPNPPGSYKDSAFIANDYEPMQGDTLATSDQIWWFCDLRDSLRFDVYIGVDTVSMALYKRGIEADTVQTNFNRILGLVNLPLDSLAPAQHYYLKIKTIHPSGYTTTCSGYSFYTQPEEQITNYCRSNETVSIVPFILAYTDLNTLHFHPDSTTITTILAHKTLVPDTGQWTTTLQQGQTYSLQCSSANWATVMAIDSHLSIYIDYNNNGSFNDPGEFYFTNPISTYIYSDIGIVVPSNAVVGQTRLRILVNSYNPYGIYAGPCDTDVEFFDFTISIAPAPGCNLSYTDSVSAPSCATYSNGSMTIFPAGGTAPYHIQWNTGYPADTLFTLAGLASPSTHRAIVSDALGCNLRTTMLQMTEPLPLLIDTSFQPSSTWIAFSGGLAPYHAEVTGYATETLYAVNDTIYLKNLQSGNYTIKATDSSNCNPKYFTLHNSILHTIVADTGSDFILYPNPATNYIQLSKITSSASITIYNATGKKVLETNSANRQVIPLPNLVPGLYLALVEEDGRKQVFKLIIN